MNQEDRDNLVPYFSSDKAQMIFEFFFLILTLIAAVLTTIVIHFYVIPGCIDTDTAALLYAGLGGFLGGWIFDAKWYYRVTARGKDDQYNYKWQRHKFYWRILIPFVSGLVAFSVYVLVSSDALPIAIRDTSSGRTAFGLSFVLGYFSDAILSRLANWTEAVMLIGRDK